MKHLKRLLNGVVIFLVLLFLVVGYIAYGLTHPDDEIPDLPTEFAVNAELSSLSWDKEPHRFYYLSEAGIYAIELDKKPTKLIFKNKDIRDFFLVDATKSIYAFTDEEIFVTDQDGKNSEKIFTLPESWGSISYQVYVSPDEKELVFFVTSSSARTVIKLYKVDADTNQITEFPSKENFITLDSNYIQGFYWLKNSKEFVWILDHMSDEIDKAQVIKTNTETLRSELLKEIDHKRTDSDWISKIQLAKLISSDELTLPTRKRLDGSWPIIGTSVKSPNGANEYLIKHNWGKSTLYVNGEKLFSWNAEKNGYFSPVGLIKWIDDEHLLLKVWDINRREYRIYELPTKKISMLYDGEPRLNTEFQAKWFGQKDYLPKPQEW